LGTGINTGTSFLFLVIILIKDSYPWKSYADFDIYSRDPPLKEDSNIGNKADSYVWSTIDCGGMKFLCPRNDYNILRSPKIWSDCYFRASYCPVKSHF
jgi:hypothetical protein